MEIRKIKAQTVCDTVKKLFTDCNYFIGKDIMCALETARDNESSPVGKSVLSQIIENDKIAAREEVPLCQDTGMAVLFVEYGDRVVIEDGSFDEAVNEGVRRAYIDGYHGDNAYTYAVGAVSPVAEKLMRVTNECLNLGIAAAQPGNRVGDIGFAVQKHAEENGFGVVREYVGHGVGRDLHEEPEVPNYGRRGRGARLVPGMTIAIEPMITEGSYNVKVMPNEWTVKTVDGGLAAHFERTIAITGNGPVILTDW